MSFNVVVNSADCVDGATIKKRMRYYFDFNFFKREKCDYELSFAFRSTDTNTIFDKIVYLSLPDLPQSNYTVASKVGAASTGVFCEAL